MTLGLLAITGSVVVLKGGCVQPFHMLVVLLSSACRAFSCSLLFPGSPPLSLPFFNSLICYLEGCPMFIQFSMTGAGAGARFFWQVGLMAGLQALRCSSYLGLGFEPLCSPAPNLHMRQRPNNHQYLWAKNVGFVPGISACVVDFFFWYSWWGGLV